MPTPAAKAMAVTGLPVLASRTALAATIAPLTGPDAQAMAEATRRAERAGARLMAGTGPSGLDGPGLAAVRAAIQTYRDGGSISSATGPAWLAFALTRLRIRDDAWARMDSEHRDAHRRLWTDLACRAQPGYVAAPTSLLAFTAWQGGEGALANIALDRALADSPGCSMAQLLRELLDAGTRPSVIRRAIDQAYPLTRKTRLTYSGSGYNDGHAKRLAGRPRRPPPPSRGPPDPGQRWPVNPGT